jgi:NADH-ubiquinone oxidoreductase chain 5
LTYGTFHVSGLFAYWLGTLSAFFTSFYSIRLVYLTFIKPNNSSKGLINGAHESSTIMLIPLWILGFGSIFVGFLFKDLFLGLGVDTWNSSLFQLVTHVSFFESEFLSYKIKLIPFIFSIMGSISAIAVYHIFEKNLISLNIYKKVYYIYSFFVKKWYFDNIYNAYIVNNILNFGYHISFKSIDRGVLELFGPLGIVRTLSVLTKKISNFQSGLIYHYVFMMILGATFFILLFMLSNYLSATLLVVFFYFFIYLTHFNKKN